ncbi:hypothetical protein DERP_015083 [Dermatophagoides pteronyssinus]|uniref:Uncharacterized protein n=1 Tax=Dermatophagoides pteronyssinus TaxID=6956 RepID=A0ABQ8JRY9_DERPT|nr:hypothetical protein DERP_015083 [Dermatophagoides pteronyssinus]
MDLLQQLPPEQQQPNEEEITSYTIRMLDEKKPEDIFDMIDQLTLLSTMLTEICKEFSEEFETIIGIEMERYSMDKYKQQQQQQEEEQEKVQQNS